MSDAAKRVFSATHQAAVRETMKGCPVHALDDELPDFLQEKLDRLDAAFAGLHGEPGADRSED